MQLIQWRITREGIIMSYILISYYRYSHSFKNIVKWKKKNIYWFRWFLMVGNMASNLWSKDFSQLNKPMLILYAYRKRRVEFNF